MKILLQFILLLSLLPTLSGNSINESLLKIHATLIPKIYLMDYKFEDKLKNNTISIAIIYHDNNYKEAQVLKNRIETRYKEGLKSYHVSAQLITYDDLTTASANVFYLLPSTKEDINRAVKQANHYQALTFSYLSEDLKYGVMISLNVEKNVKPILNLEAIKLHKISLRPVLIDISNIYIDDGDSLLEHFQIKGYNDFRIYKV